MKDVKWLILFNVALVITVFVIGWITGSRSAIAAETDLDYAWAKSELSSACHTEGGILTMGNTMVYAPTVGKREAAIRYWAENGCDTVVDP